MPDFILKGGVFIMVPLVACMIVSLGIMMERAFALRRSLLISSSVARAVELFKSPDDLDRLIRLCQSDDSGLSRLIQTALDHLGWPKTENMEAVTTRPCVSRSPTDIRQRPPSRAGAEQRCVRRFGRRGTNGLRRESAGCDGGDARSPPGPAA